MKKTVLLTSNMYRPNIGGIENSLYHMSQGYLDLGYHCVICVSDIGPNGRALSAYETDGDIEIFRYQISNKRGVSRFIGHWIMAIRLLQYLRLKYQPEIVICRNHQLCIALKLAGFKQFSYLVPGVVKFQNAKSNLALSGKSKLSRFAQKLNIHLNEFIQLLAFKYAKRVFVFSQNMLKQVGQVSPRLKGNIEIVKPGVDTQRFVMMSPTQKEALRESLNLQSQGPVYLCIGRFVQAKGFDLAIEAMQFVSQGTLWIVGDGAEYMQYLAKIELLSLQHKVKIIPSSNEPELCYSAADYFIMSSRYEPLGQTILEALASGLPIIAFSEQAGVTTATAELLDAGSLFVAEKLSGESLARAMLKASVTYDTETYRQLSTRNRQQAVADFCWLTLCHKLNQSSI
ncbi:glycosyltransferase family 4 protein [Alteromonadaceae bacterium BrNp21-10]|nr:glycosyltransferase family 4 protein [Alteromonadaceae bacterium BrNp21-10]